MVSNITSDSEELRTKYSDEKVSKAAKTDALQLPPIPAWHSPNHSSYIFGVKNFVEEEMQALGGRWKKDEEKLNVLIEQTKQDYQNKTKLANAAKVVKENAEKEFRAEKSVAPPPGDSYNTTIYWIALVAFVVVTVGINVIAFQSSQVSIQVAVIIGLFMAIVLVSCAHVFGANVQRKDFLTNKKRLLLLCIVFIIPIILIVAVGQFHQENTEQSWITFGGANYSIFLIVSAIAYFYYDEVLFKVMNARKKFAKYQVEATEAYKLLMGTVKEHDGTFHQYVARKRALDQRFSAIRNKYQEVNLQFRVDKMEYGTNGTTGMPESFTVRIDLELPGSLQEGNYTPPNTTGIIPPLAE